MGDIKSVGSAAGLLQALSTAKAGTTIELAGGDYGVLSLNGIWNHPWARFSGEVTIRSANPNNPATFDGIGIRGVENLTFDGIVVDYEIPKGVNIKALSWNNALLVNESKNIVIRNSVIDGDLLDDPSSPLHGLPVTRGLFIRNSTDVLVENNEISKFVRGGNFADNSDLTVRGNEVHTIRSDGFDFSAAQNVLIEKNHLHDFITKPGIGDHRDMIQFWTQGTNTPSTGVTIRDNFLDSGGGPYTQSIFMRNERVDTGAAGQEMFYRNVVIENNVIYNAQSHGITVGEADGVVITNNTLLHNPDSGFRGGVSLPRINLAKDARNVHVERNITEAVVPEQPPGNAVGWKIADNLFVQNRDPGKPNYYGDLFENALAGGADTGLEALQALPGIILQKGYGSHLTSSGTGGGGPVVSPENPVELPEEPAPAPAPVPGPSEGALSFGLAVAYDDGTPIDGALTDGEVLALDDVDDGRVTMVATPSEGVGSVRLNLLGVHELVENAAPYALFGDNNGNYNTGATLDAGDYEMVLTAYSGANGGGSVLGSQTISFSVAGSSEIVHRWNAGPNTVAAVDGGPDWVSDPGAVTGSAKLFSSSIGTLDASVPGTTPKGVFAHQYYGNDARSPMGLDFGNGALADGLYAVRLYMADGYSVTDTPGERAFDVSVEGELFLDDLDLVARLGNNTGGMFEWQGQVTDGTIDIDFAHVARNPLVDAVEIIRIDGDFMG